MLYTVKDKPISKHISRQSNTGGSRLSASTFPPLITHCLTLILFTAVIPSFPPLTFTSYSKLMNSPRISFTPPCLTCLGDFPLKLLPVSTFTLLKEEKGSSGTKETAVGGSQRSIFKGAIDGGKEQSWNGVDSKVLMLMGSSPAGAWPEALEVICCENKHVLQQ